VSPFTLLLSPRSFLCLALVAATLWLASHVGHHVHPDVFQALFLHLSPAQLEFGHEPLSIAVPEFLHFFTKNSAGHPTGELAVTNLQVFQVAAVLLVLVAFSGVARHLRTGKGDPLSRMLAGWCQWIRDEMVYPNMGRERGRKFLPYFLCLFFFILFMNVFGLLPWGATATASIYVTCALALTTFVAMVVGGMVAQGPLAYWKNLVPHVPWWLWPLMFVVELVGLAVKPFALMIRLFANMTGGHLIVLTSMGLIMFFGAKGESPGAGYGVAPMAVAFGVFIMIIEAFVALLQAYIFTMLSIIFVNASVHPEH
jgi:F-type H+-transporting ATPase subunit a